MSRHLPGPTRHGHGRPLGPQHASSWTIGASIGISIATTVMAHQAQIVWNELGAHITLYQQEVFDYLRHLGLSPRDPRGLAVIAQQVGAQSQMIAMLDTFKLITLSYIFMAPLVLLLRRAGRGCDSGDGLD